MKLKEKKEFDFPDEKTLKNFRDKLSDPKYEAGNIALPEDANEIDRAKYQICQMILKYQRENKLLQKNLADILGIDESRMSDILRGKIEGFTLDRMIGYPEKLHPKLKIRIVAT